MQKCDMELRFFPLKTVQCTNFDRDMEKKRNTCFAAGKAGCWNDGYIIILPFPSDFMGRTIRRSDHGEIRCKHHANACGTHQAAGNVVHQEYVQTDCGAVLFEAADSLILRHFTERTSDINCLQLTKRLKNKKAVLYCC